MRFKVFCGLFLLLILNCTVLFAQPGEPCGGVDPDAICPLDTWVAVFAGAAFIFAVVHLYRKQKPSLL